MSKPSPTQDNFGNQVIKHWPLVVFLAGMFITWGVFSNRIQNTEAEILVLKLKQDKTDESVSTVKEGLVRIETSLSYIREAVEKR